MKTERWSIIGLLGGIFGIIGIFLFLIPVLAWIGFGCSVIGIFFSVIAMSSSKKETGKISGVAIAGFVCSIIGFGFGIMSAVCAARVYSSLGPLGCVSAAADLADALDALTD